MSKRRTGRPAAGGGNQSPPANPLLTARKKLEQAEALRQAGKLAPAQKLCEAILKHFPDYVGALHTQGLILADRGKYTEALSYLVQAAMHNPRDWTTLTALSGVYLKLGARVMAARTLTQALERRPDDANILATLGEVYREDREFEAAAAAFRKALEIDPAFDAAALGLGLVCTELGDLAEAAEAFERLLDAGRHPSKLLYGLSQFPLAFVRTDILERAGAVVPEPGEAPEEFETAMAFARGAALDRAGRHDEAWPQLETANRRMLDRVGAGYEKQRQLEQAFLERVRKAAPADGSDAGSSPRSVFIFGPSRSGKTSLERLLATCVDVKRGYENPILEHTVRGAFRTAGLPTRERIVELPPQLDDLFRSLYLEDLAERAAGATAFTNTMPTHVEGALRIAALLPEARFIFLKRDIHDIALRIFMKAYRAGNPYAYDLGTIREHVSWYDDMTAVLAEKLGARAMVIGYEDMVVDPEAALNTVAALCGLERSDEPLPELGDDRGCAEPYRARMDTAWQAR